MTPDSPRSSASGLLLLAQSLTLGFATAVGMWVAAFLAHLPILADNATPLRVVGLLMVQVVGALMAGKLASSGRGLLVGALAGATTGILNLLILGSVIASPESASETGGATRGLIPGAPGFILGYFILSTLLGALGGWLGSRARKGFQVASADTWLARFGFVNALAIIPLLFVGGLVTSTASGMAFPDWPTSDGRAMFLYPLSLMTGNHQRFYEHSHRLFGALVGVTAFALMLLTILIDTRPRIKLAAAGFFGLVVVQGLLGAARVMGESPAAGMIHGILGQLTFGSAVALAAMLTSAYRDQALPRATTVRLGTTWWLLGALLGQLALGAMYRHLGHKHVIYSHAAVALLPTIFAAIVAFSAKRGKNGNRTEHLIARLGTGLLHGINLQWLLGLGALLAVVWYPDRTMPHTMRVVLGTLHQFNGALILALAVLMTVWVGRGRRG